MGLGLDFNSVAEYRLAIDVMVDAVMENEITEKAQDALMDSIETNVYDAYPPIYRGRPDTIESPRRENGGLKDRSNLQPSYTPSTKTLVIEAVAPWQNVGFKRTNERGIYDKSLAEVVESKGMYGAGPREFTWFAEDEYGRKRFAADLRSALINRGL